MIINIPDEILGLKGQCVNQFRVDQDTNTIIISCQRDMRELHQIKSYRN